LLWPEAPEARARHRLNVAVHELRRLLGEAILRSDGDRLTLDVGQLSIDVIDFENALQAGNVARAAEVYTGPFLDGFSLPAAVDFEHWMESERDALAQRFRDALGAFVQRLDQAEDAWSSFSRIAPM
jgi:DNA-binding SARP family transcriptional activator